jgi:Family of unknown function (DUF6527)
MGAKVKLLKSEQYPNCETWIFFCPGCKYNHPFTTKWDAQEMIDNKKWYDQVGMKEHPLWTFNGDVERPTFNPSLLCNQHYPKQRCHLFVEGGKIRFLDDCHHELKGKTVEMQDYETD